MAEADGDHRVAILLNPDGGVEIEISTAFTEADVPLALRAADAAALLMPREGVPS